MNIAACQSGTTAVLYTVLQGLHVESVEGNPFDLENLTLYQDTYSNIPKAFAPITKVEKLNVGMKYARNGANFRSTQGRWKRKAV